VKAIFELQAAGFAFTVQGDKVSYRWTRPTPSDPEKMAPLLAELKAKKEQVREYLMMQPGHCEVCAACGHRDGYGRMSPRRYCFYSAYFKAKTAKPVPIAEAQKTNPKRGEADLRESNPQQLFLTGSDELVPGAGEPT
jgi:hypothetical protein